MVRSTGNKLIEIGILNWKGLLISNLQPLWWKPKCKPKLVADIEVWLCVCLVGEYCLYQRVLAKTQIYPLLFKVLNDAHLLFHLILKPFIIWPIILDFSFAIPSHLHVCSSFAKQLAIIKSSWPGNLCLSSLPSGLPPSRISLSITTSVQPSSIFFPYIFGLLRNFSTLQLSNVVCSLYLFVHLYLYT